MQATLDSRALKPFTRALACISKYGDEMVIHAKPEAVVLTSLNQAKSAFCSFTYSRSFFSKYAIAHTPNSTKSRSSSGSGSSGRGQHDMLTCQLQTKALLTILRHRNTEKSTEKCELTIIDGTDVPGEEVRADEDSFESRLIIRLHCKHGVVKTHRLLLNTPTNDMAPIIENNEEESRICIQPQAIREIIEHFPNAKGPKNDPELIWRFDADEVSIKSMEKGIDAKGKSQLATELCLNSVEFDVYEIHTFPMTLGFFLREFNATVALADALDATLELRFTLPAEPLYISADADACSMLFVIATNQIRGSDGPDGAEQPQRRNQSSQPSTNNRAPSASGSATGIAQAKKRALESETEADRRTLQRSEGRKSMKVVQSQKSSNTTQASSGPSRSGNVSRSPQEEQTMDVDMPYPFSQAGADEQPLFLASQLPAADVAAISASGLGIEKMNAEEFAAMLDEEEGEEVGDDSGIGLDLAAGSNAHRETIQLETTASARNGVELEFEDEYDEFEEEEGLGPTQKEGLNDKAFQPLFED